MINQHTPSPHRSRFLTKRTLATCSTLAGSACLLLSTPSSAFLDEQFSGSVFETIQSVVLDTLGVDRWIDALLNPCSERYPMDEQMCGPGGSSGGAVDTADIFQNSTGVLGIPNPNQTRQKTAEATQAAVAEGRAILDVFEINPTVFSVYAANQQDRLTTRAAIETVLGDAGQEQMDADIKSISETVEDAANDADEAQSAEATQDVTKKMTRILAYQTILAGGIYTNGLRARTDTQLTNLNLLNSSRTLDALARSERSHTTAGAMWMYDLIGLSKLY